MSERRDVHVHVERDDPYSAPRDYEREVIAEEPAASSFLTAQFLWIALIVLLVILLIAALGGGVIDFSGADDAVNPTAAP